MAFSSRSLVSGSSTLTKPGRFQIQSLAIVGVKAFVAAYCVDGAFKGMGSRIVVVLVEVSDEKSSKLPKSSCFRRVRNNSMACRATNGPYTSSSAISCCLMPAGNSAAIEIMPMPRINMAIMSSTKLKARLECCRVIALIPQRDPCSD